MNESSRRFRVLRFAFVNGARRCSSFLSCPILTEYSFFNVLFLSRQLEHPYRNYFAVCCMLRIVEQITIKIRGKASLCNRLINSDVCFKLLLNFVQGLFQLYKILEYSTFLA